MIDKKFLFLLMLVVGLGACSSSKNAGVANSASSSAAAPSSRSTGAESSSSAMSSGRSSTKKGNSKVLARSHADMVKEAEERMEDNAKRRKKEAKLAEKPQYSDPTYFGHKKKPKKNSVKKRKLCKECGIVH